MLTILQNCSVDTAGANLFPKATAKDSAILLSRLAVVLDGRHPQAYGEIARCGIAELSYLLAVYLVEV